MTFHCIGHGDSRLGKKGRLVRVIFPSYVKVVTVGAFKDAIAKLPEDNRQSLAAWLNDFGYDAWEKQMSRDFMPGGRGAAWAENVKRQIGEGKVSSMDEGFAERSGPST